MNAGRRGFLTYLASSISMLGCAVPSAPVQGRRVADDLGSWDGVRRQFLLDADWLHFAGFLLASHPQPVRDAIEQHRRGLDRNPALYLHEHEPTAEDNVRRAAASYINAD